MRCLCHGRKRLYNSRFLIMAAASKTPLQYLKAVLSIRIEGKAYEVLAW